METDASDREREGGKGGGGRREMRLKKVVIHLPYKIPQRDNVR